MLSVCFGQNHWGGFTTECIAAHLHLHKHEIRIKCIFYLFTSDRKKWYEQYEYLKNIQMTNYTKSTRSPLGKKKKRVSRYKRIFTQRHTMVTKISKVQCTQHRGSRSLRNRLTLTLCSQLGSKKWALPFGSAVSLWSWLTTHFQTLWHLKNTIPLWSPIITGRRIQRNNGANTAHLPHIKSSLPKKWQWPKIRRPTVTICPSDWGDGKSVFGHHFSLS